MTGTPGARAGRHHGMRRPLRAPGFLSLLLLVQLAACGSSPSEPVVEGGAGQGGGGAGGGVPDAPPYASSIVAFEPGEGAGFGQSKLPGVVLGPPLGKGVTSGSLDVLSLGKGGSIVLGFEPLALVDGDGPDLVVFENAFWPGGDASAVFAEPGEVSVSDDGEEWHTFPCDAEGDGEGHFAGCAGVTPTEKYDASAVVPLVPALTGGDAFDLAELGVARARFVRIRDRANAGATPSAGLDLDAVGVIAAERGDAEP